MDSFNFHTDPSLGQEKFQLVSRSPQPQGTTDPNSSRVTSVCLAIKEHFWSVALSTEYQIELPATFALLPLQLDHFLLPIPATDSFLPQMFLPS